MSAVHILVDLEATCWNTEPLASQQREESEIIELGAVMVSPALEVMGEFQTFIRPLRHPILSPFCTKLTTITQADVDVAPLYADAMRDFYDWSASMTEETTILGSWGKYDHNQLRRECALNGVAFPWPENHQHVNVKVMYAYWSGRQGSSSRQRGMGRAVEELGLSFEGTHHRGIDDARMLTQIFQHIMDPRHASSQAKTVLDMARELGRPFTVSDARRLIHLDAKRWWPSALKELCMLGLIELRPHGDWILRQ